MKLAAAFLVAFACSTAFASEPGQPLDCSDWVFLEPGYSCTVFARMGPGPVAAALFDKGTNKVVGNTGSVLVVGDVNLGGFSIIKYDDTGPRELGRISPRMFGSTVDNVSTKDPCPIANGSSGALYPVTFSCPGPNPTVGRFDLNGSIAFDAVRGRLLVTLRSDCYPFVGTCPPDYGGGWWIAAINGFATTFDVLQTYTPQPASLGFHVPYMPDGLPAADHFDTYWGNLTHPIDFAQAHPLQCGFPAAPPHVGDYLTVADSLPDPSPGTGRYYVTAATYQGATRYGRKAMGGQLSGRDPALLPVCSK